MSGTFHRRWPSGGGTQPPLLLIHGVGVDHSMWVRLAALLCHKREVIAYDLLGHGQSEKPPGPYSLDDFVVQLVRLLDELKLGPIDLMGFSMGALVAEGFALAHPKRLRRLMLLNGVYDRSPQERQAVLSRVAAVQQGGYGASIEAGLERWFTPDFRVLRPDVLDQERQRMQKNDLAAFAAAYKVFGEADESLAPRLAAIAHPTLVMTGENDRRSTAEMARRLAALLPQGQCLIFPGQRHSPATEIPSELAKAIEGFLS